MAARSRKIRHDEETRAKIQTSQLINRLYGHVVGDVELSSTQVRAAEVLLKKTLPDLTSTEIDATVMTGSMDELTIEQKRARAESLAQQLGLSPFGPVAGSA